MTCEINNLLEPICKIEDDEMSSSLSSSEQQDLSNLKKINNKKRRKNQTINWVLEKKFPTKAEAIKAIKNEKTWSLVYSNLTSQGRKDYYRCNKIKRKKGGTECSARIYLHLVNNNNVSLFRSVSPHDLCKSPYLQHQKLISTPIVDDCSDEDIEIQLLPEIIMIKKIHFSILTISDRCSRKEKQDESGPLLKQLIESIQNDDYSFEVSKYEIIPDDQELIKENLIKFSKEKEIKCIITTGGTGLTKRDVTPEATGSVIEKECPGIAYALISASLNITPMAMLSRLKCGILNDTLIINLPGSKKACMECFDVIKPILKHAIDQLDDQTSDVDALHQKMQQQEFVSIKSRAKEIPVSERPRHSTFEMIPISQALEKLLKEITDYFINSDKNDIMIDVQVKAENLFKYTDYVLSEDLFALVSLPPFNASIKDGYAVIAEDGSGNRKVLKTSSVAGLNKVPYITSGFCARISTGAAVPEGANAVVQVEDTILIETNQQKEEITIKINTEPKIGQDIRPIGSDIPIDKINPLISKYETLTAINLGLIASTGIKNFKVFKRPIVAVLSTGDEIADVGQTRAPNCIWDSNRTVLMSLLHQSNFETIDLGISPDSFDNLFQIIHKGLKKADVLITTGSVSMGERDLLKQILVEDFHARIHFGRVNVKPGKPTTFATMMFEQKKKFIFSLPGNPVSAFVTFKLFVESSLRLISGEYFQNLNQPLSNIFHKRIKCKVLLDQPYKLDTRVEFVRAKIEFKINDDNDNDNSLPVAKLTESNQISSRLLNVKNANGLLCLDPKKFPNGYLNDGDIISAILF